MRSEKSIVIVTHSLLLSVQQLLEDLNRVGAITATTNLSGGRAQLVIFVGEARDTAIKARSAQNNCLISSWAPARWSWAHSRSVSM